MEALRVESSINDQMEPKWRTMLTISFVLHLAVFSLFLFLPEHMPTRRIKGTIYHVNLVELPAKSTVKVEGKSKVKPGKTGKALPITKKTAPAKRISRSKKKEKPVVIAKRTVKTKKEKVKKQPVAPSKLIDRALSKIEKKIKAEEKNASRRIDQALSKIEKQVKTEEEDYVERAISKLEKQGSGATVKGYPGGRALTGIAIEIYKREVEDWIKSNWSYPVSIASPRGREDLEAIIVIKAKSDGSILKSWFIQKSSNVIFDQSVLKAVEQSDPLPRFPPGYRLTHEEFEITFNLREMES